LQKKKIINNKNTFKFLIKIIKIINNLRPIINNNSNNKTARLFTKMLQKLRNVTTSIATTITNTNTSTKSDFKKEINNNSSSKNSIIKKAMSMDSLNQKTIFSNTKKRNASLDSNSFINIEDNSSNNNNNNNNDGDGDNNWFINNEMKNDYFKRYSDSYMIALIGKPNVGKSTIIRTGLNNLAPITNVGKEESLVYAPTLTTEIDVDDHSYPAQVLEIQENVFNMKSSSLKWPKDLPDIDGVLVCYDVTSRASIVNIAWLLNAFKEFQVPMILVACKADCDESERQVPPQYGVKLGYLFHGWFVGLNTRDESRIQ